MREAMPDGGPVHRPGGAAGQGSPLALPRLRYAGRRVRQRRDAFINAKLDKLADRVAEHFQRSTPMSSSPADKDGVRTPDHIQAHVATFRAASLLDEEDT